MVRPVFWCRMVTSGAGGQVVVAASGRAVPGAQGAAARRGRGNAVGTRPRRTCSRFFNKRLVQKMKSTPENLRWNSGRPWPNAPCARLEGTAAHQADLQPGETGDALPVETGAAAVPGAGSFCGGDSDDARSRGVRGQRSVLSG